MKTVFKSLVLIAAAAIALNSCSKNDAVNSVKPEDMVTLKFRINNADESTVSKALLGTENGKNFLNWEDGDKIGTFSVGTFGQNTTSNNNPGTVEVDNNGYTLNVQTYNAGTVTNIYSYYPYSASAGKSKEAAVIEILDVQNMTNLGFDADAMPMAGSPLAVDLTTLANTDTPCGDITFSNLGSIIDFKVYSSVATDETITSVKYVSPSKNIAGNYTIDLTGIDASDETTLALQGDGTKGEITTYAQTHPAIGTGKANAVDIFMVVAPGAYSGTQVVVTTNLRTYTLTASGEKTYTRSHVKPMNVDIQNGTPGALPVEETWTKVTSASEMTEGTYYILTGDESKYLPNDEAGSAPTAKSFSGVVSADMRWEATASGSGLVFKNPSSDLYLWGNDGTNNGVRVKENAPSNAYANVWLFTDDQTLGVLASVGSTRYLAAYNNSGTLQDWRNYQSGNSLTATNQALFYKLSVVDPRPAPGMSWSAESVTATYNTGNTLSFTAPTLTVGNATGITYSSSDETIATISDAGVVSVNLTDNVVKEGSTTISAIYTATDNGLYKSQTVSYTLTVADNRAAATAPTFSPVAGEVSANQVVTFQPTNESLTFHYTTNGSDPTIESPTAASVTIDAAKTVKVLATKTGYKPSAVATAAYTIAGAQANDGSLEHPYSASEARTLALNGDTGSYYIYGTVTKIQNQYSASYGTANFWIDENGTAQDVFEGYKIKYFGDQSWVEGNAQIALNDEVIIYGTLTVYNSTTPETSSGYLVSLNGTTKGLTIAAPTVTTNTANNAKEITVTWAAATGSTSAISYVVTCGGQTYNANAAGSHTFTMSEYTTYSVSVAASASDAISAEVSTTATLTDPDAGDKYYTKVSSITSGKTYLLVDHSYSMIFDGSSVATTTPCVDASSLITSNGILSTATVDAYAVTITASGTKYTVKLSTGKYLIINSSTSSNGNLTSGDTGESITISKNGDYFRFISGNRSTRGMCYRESANGFKNYATSNFGTSGYGGDFDLYEYN